MALIFVKVALEKGNLSVQMFPVDVVQCALFQAKTDGRQLVIVDQSSLVLHHVLHRLVLVDMCPSPIVLLSVRQQWICVFR